MQEAHAHLCLLMLAYRHFLVHIFLDINNYFPKKREREWDQSQEERHRERLKEFLVKTNLAWPAFFIRKCHINHSNLTRIYLKLVADSRIVSDNIFRIVSLAYIYIYIFLFSIWTILINNNVIHNHIFIYYSDSHKCNIYNLCHTKIKTIHFFSGIQKIS